MLKNLSKALKRKKTTKDDEATKLARVLTIVDLTLLGVGSTLGLGVYVLAGSVAKFEAGPSVCLSFLVAAVASAFAGICYAEFAARVPKTGSAYIYSYVTVGEFAAFIIGWNLILEYVIGTASVARGLSNYIDALANNTMKNTLSQVLPIKIDFLSDYPDFFSFLIICALTVLLSIGVKESTSLNNLFTLLNLLTVAVVLVAGSMKADPSNWFIPKDKIPADADNPGEGGFFPFGIAGVMAGAAKCFFGFVGFDAIATTGEEAKNPQRNIPIAIVISLIVIFLAYFGISTVITMMWPYYDQNPDAPFPYVFEQVGWHVIKWIVTVGAIFALCTSLLGAMFPLPRILYAMANDGLIFKQLSSINEKTKTPIKATIISGFFAGLMAMIFDLHQLIDMMSIGTLLAYTIVAVCVLILRYEPDSKFDLANTNKPVGGEIIKKSLVKVFNLNMNKYPDSTSALITKWAIGIFSIFSILFCCFIIYGGHMINSEKPLHLVLFVFLVFIIFLILLIIGRQPASLKELSFKVPWVPLIPCLSIVVNLYLMLELDVNTWVRFSVWLIVGFLIYFFYGIKNSKEEEKIRLQEKEMKAMGIENPYYLNATPEEAKREMTRF